MPNIQIRNVSLDAETVAGQTLEQFLSSNARSSFSENYGGEKLKQVMTEAYNQCVASVPVKTVTPKADKKAKPIVGEGAE